ncbi:DUF6265 family protein [Sphingomonas edaphi]|jgi:hypothetical protein|uniref:DUF6265 domain-containing protein n=1 Tax=Sphingomonas edaphi TaxID=2315689 RepID=A0A418Q113_9SPHN|nr:DUF6265 family protein [Sphingomonas edaphi]RIX31706.1 hypothetical protein D3M59_01475 [Sphingomonas edaphi]
MLAIILALAEPSANLPLPAFLAGCWIERKADDWTEECWTAPKGGQMMGSARTGKGDRVTHWEWMRIERDTLGNPVFHASPKGAPVASFPVVRATATEIEWRNHVHDYPQRIIYRLTADGIYAEISLVDGSKPNRWTYRRSN